MNKSNRRKFIGRGVAAAAAVTATAIPTAAAAQAEKPVKKVHYRNGRKPDKPPLFNGTVSFGNLLFIARRRPLRGRHQGAHETRPRSDPGAAHERWIVHGEGPEV
jgi:hypothetical protein